MVAITKTLKCEINCDKECFSSWWRWALKELDADQLNHHTSSRLCCARQAYYPRSKMSRSASRMDGRPSRWWDLSAAWETRRCARKYFSSLECSSRSWSQKFLAGDPWRSGAQSFGSFSRLCCRLEIPLWKCKVKENKDKSRCQQMKRH